MFIWSVAVAEGLALGLYALLVEPSRLALTFVRRIDPRVPRTVRFLLLSDLHLRPFSHRTYRRIARAARWAERHGAVAALIAGDLLEDDREAALVAERLRRSLRSLRAVYVTGNHEATNTWQRWPFRSNDPDVVDAGMRAHGIERIDERAIAIGDVSIVGIGWRRRLGASAAHVALLDRLDPPGPAIVLAHSPDHITGLEPARVLVALCGHTHGGQVRLPVIGAPWIPVRSRLPAHAGAMRVAGLPTYVSRGIGATVPVRLGAVPEATLIEVGPVALAAPPDALTTRIIR